MKQKHIPTAIWSFKIFILKIICKKFLHKICRNKRKAFKRNPHTHSTSVYFQKSANLRVCVRVLVLCSPSTSLGQNATRITFPRERSWRLHVMNGWALALRNIWQEEVMVHCLRERKQKLKMWSWGGYRSFVIPSPSTVTMTKRQQWVLGTVHRGQDICIEQWKKHCFWA